METSELVDLQLHADAEEPEVASHTEGQKSLEQPDITGRAVGNTMTSRWKKIYLSVLTLLGYASVYAAMATVTAFYAIVVSLIVTKYVFLEMCENSTPDSNTVFQSVLNVQASRLYS